MPILFLQNVRGVPLTDVDVHVPTHIKVVGHGIRVVVIAHHHGGVDFGNEGQSLAGIMRLEVIRVDAFVTLGVRLEPLSHLIVVVAADFVTVTDEVNFARLDIEHQSATAGDRQRSLDAVFFADGLDLGGQSFFAILRNISHLLLHLFSV